MWPSRFAALALILGALCLWALACAVMTAAMPAPDTEKARLLEHALLASGALSYGGWLAMPVQRYGQTHGVLVLGTSGAVDLGDLAGQIEKLSVNGGVIRLDTLTLGPKDARCWSG